MPLFVVLGAHCIEWHLCAGAGGGAGLPGPIFAPLMNNAAARCPGGEVDTLQQLGHLPLICNTHTGRAALLSAI